MSGRLLGWAVLVTLSSALPSAATGLAVQLHAADGVSIAGMVYDAPDPAAPAVVLVHMYTRTKDDWRGLAEQLQAAGIAALAIDLRGHGGSAGAALPSSVMALDVRAGIAYLESRAAGRKIAVVGASLGASVGLMAAAETATVRGVALVSPVSDYRGVRLDPAVRRYRGRPLLFITSLEDPYSWRTVKGLTEQLKAPEQHVSGAAAHGTYLLERDPEAMTVLVDWLRRTLLS